MALQHRLTFRSTRPFEETMRRVVKKLQTMSFPVHHVEDLRTATGKRVVIVLGVSTPLRGSTFLSAVFHGMRYVPYFVRVTEDTADSCEVFVYAGGAEEIVPLDFGRNKGVAEAILDGFPGEVIPTPEPSGPESEPVAWRDSAPGL